MRRKVQEGVASSRAQAAVAALRALTRAAPTIPLGATMCESC